MCDILGTVGDAKQGFGLSPMTLVYALRILISGRVLMKRAPASSGNTEDDGDGAWFDGMFVDNGAAMMDDGCCGYGGGSRNIFGGMSSPMGSRHGPRNPVVSWLALYGGGSGMGFLGVNTTPVNDFRFLLSTRIGGVGGSNGSSSSSNGSAAEWVSLL